MRRAPPTTDTELDASFAGEEEQAYRGISPQEVAAAIIEGMKADKQEILIGQAQGLYQAALRDPEAIFKQLNDVGESIDRNRGKVRPS